MNPSRSNRSAFTLIELMMVTAIMVIAMTMAWPTFSSIVHRAPLSQSVQNVEAMCTKARRMAILHGEDWQVRISPLTGQMTVEKVPVDAPPPDSLNTDPNAAPPVPTNGPVYQGEQPKPDDSYSAQISDQVHIDLLDVNFVECKDMEMTTVRFTPNGTSDDFTIIMSCAGEYRQVSLEVVTGLADVESDPNKFGRAK